MLKPYSWQCPYCQHHATITEGQRAQQEFRFNHRNKDGTLLLSLFVTVCPNQNCREYTIDAVLNPITRNATGQEEFKQLIHAWQLKPQSNAKPYPTYIPEPIRKDYEEACAIKELSPKASATLSRRCLQGILRDFWQVKPVRLVDEIAEIQSKVSQEVWGAIDGLRKMGNIGAHMEKDINVIVDVDPTEAALLIELLEMLFEEWYVIDTKDN